MENHSSNNRRLAKNTLMLYIRMLMVILVNLYTSRIVLNALGFSDFGIYSIVGSIVVFLGFLNTSMAAAAQRFLSFYKVKENADSLNSIFNSIFVVQLIISTIIIIAGESLGILYIENYLNIDTLKISDAKIVFHFSLAAFVIKILSVPYNASIFANEQMGVFAFFSILEVLLQLLVSYIITLFQDERMIIYACLMFMVVLFIQSSYIVYCKVHFHECHIRHNWNWTFIKTILSYSGWNLLGTFSGVAIDQGVNMILNSFFGVIVNTARGIAFQVSNALSNLSQNFQQALNPQIVKCYAQNELQEMAKLIFLGCRFSFLLLFCIAVPVIFNIDTILVFWLKNVPQYTAVFCILVICNAIVVSLSGPLLIGAMATGKIKKYQIIVASINFLNFPLSILLLNYYPNPYITVLIMIAISIASLIARLYLVSRMIHFSIRAFLKEVVVRVICTSIVTLTILYLIYITDIFMNSLALVQILICLFVSISCVIMIGITKNEKRQAIAYIQNKFFHK